MQQKHGNNCWIQRFVINSPTWWEAQRQQVRAARQNIGQRPNRWGLRSVLKKKRQVMKDRMWNSLLMMMNSCGLSAFYLLKHDLLQLFTFSCVFVNEWVVKQWEDWVQVECRRDWSTNLLRVSQTCGETDTEIKHRKQKKPPKPPRDLNVHLYGRLNRHSPKVTHAAAF